MPQQKAVPSKRRKAFLEARRNFNPILRYPISEASLLLTQSVAKTYVDIKAERIKIIKDGKRTYIPGAEIIRLSTLPA